MNKTAPRRILSARIFKPCLAALALAAASAFARTVTLDAIDGTAATVTVGPGDAGETIRLAYGKAVLQPFCVSDLITPRTKIGGGWTIISVR